MRFILRLLHEDEGQDLTEYGLLACFISIVAVVTVRNIGPLVDALYQVVQDAFN